MARAQRLIPLEEWKTKSRCNPDEPDATAERREEREGDRTKERRGLISYRSNPGDATGQAELTIMNNHTHLGQRGGSAK
ncbi:hypothetical protein NDU88_005571 [Pleurodeles waltl]|uniref:Uncharacterized protein n=1 Tax=Pleurodeles waltl TaxID=8319 RepID=A0AAV7LLI5_PLEWA|nr:hypothetical protein NDU88_005571 [Pleurodeles waltl]